MDSYHIHNLHDIKVEKANKMRKHRRIQKVTALFRLVEICVFMIILSRSSTLLPNFPLKFSGEYIKGLFVSLVSPGFVFVIGNAIVIVLFLNSSEKASSSSSADQEGSKNNNVKVDLYDEYVARCQRSANQIVRFEETKSISAAREVIGRDSNHSLKAEKRIRRIRSENSMKNTQKIHGEPGRELRRSATETCLKSVEKRSVSSYPVDQMSNEEFRCRVEAFIARQQRLLREEEEDF